MVLLSDGQSRVIQVTSGRGACTMAAGASMLTMAPHRSLDVELISFGLVDSICSESIDGSRVAQLLMYQRERLQPAGVEIPHRPGIGSDVIASHVALI